MQLLSHEDPNVRYEALVAVQKLMVHNWYVFISQVTLSQFFINELTMTESAQHRKSVFMLLSPDS